MFSGGEPGGGTLDRADACSFGGGNLNSGKLDLIRTFSDLCMCACVYVWVGWGLNLVWRGALCACVRLPALPPGICSNCKPGLLTSQ